MKVSLLESESIGGAIAREGFGYQDAYVLQHLPLYLSQPAFSHVVSEAIGDVEVCYHGTIGIVRVFIEAKGGDALSWTKFWDEIKRFKKVKATASDEYSRFMLVCREFNSSTAPLVSKLERLRGVGRSFAAGSPLLAKTRQEIIDWGISKRQPRELLEFVIDEVEFITYADENAYAAFQGEIAQQLPSLDMRTRDVSAFRAKCVSLVTRSSRNPVYRLEIENALLGVLGDEASQWMTTPTALELREPSYTELGARAAPFNGRERLTLAHEDWEDMRKQIGDVGQFIRRSRMRPAVALSGKHRLSMACVLGDAFSATKEFILHVEHNGVQYHTNNHAQESEPFFTETTVAGAGGEGVVTVALPTEAAMDVAAAMEGTLRGAHSLSMFSERAIDSMASLNRAVAETKAALYKFRSTNRLQLIHLFLKTPSHFAMVLGHRLNGIGPVQLYDWVEGRYVRTALLA